MNLIKTSLFSLIVVGAFLRAGVAQANKGEKILLDGVDITAFVDYYRPAVKTLNKSVTAFNWSKGASDPFWDEDRDQGDPELVNYARHRAKSFWKYFGSKDVEGNNYGFGLYAAADPVVTNNYGGGPTSWVLLQMELPIGFKMIDLTLNEASIDSVSPAKMQIIAGKFKCPEDTKISDFFVGGGNQIDSLCRKLVQKVFADIFEIDGFAYPYAATNFQVCEVKPYVQLPAFVITNPNSIHSENIRYFTNKTLSDRENRIRIQTLFFKDVELRTDSLGYRGLLGKDIATKNAINYLKNHPQNYIRSSITKCEKTCIITFRFCRLTSDKCAEIPFETMPNRIMNAAEATQTIAQGLLWPDMEGVKMSPTIDSWLLQNRYACDGKRPY